MANKCGDCRFFQGSSVKCGGGQSGRQSGSTACADSYAPIVGKNKDKAKFNYKTAIIITIMAIVVFCIVSVYFRVTTSDDFPVNYSGAVLSSLIGALITLVLLRGQTDIEEKKGKDIKILEKKAEVFQHFIDSVWKVWVAQEITIEKFDELTKQYYQNLMIYLKDESMLIKIGRALTEIAEKIDKTTYEDRLVLRRNIITIINTLSEDIGLGGTINETIIEEHDKAVFPTRLKKDLLNKLNEALRVTDNASPFKEGKYEYIWEGKRCEFITFDLKDYPGIKLAIGVIGGDFLDLVFMADHAIQIKEEFRDKYWYKRLKNNPDARKALRVSDPIPDEEYLQEHSIADEDNEPIPRLDFSNEDSMKMFRENPKFPDILSKRVLYHLNEWWKIDGLGYIEFFEKYLKQ